jgi:uncharacterized membrane protein YkvA (DUF1232 family)
MATFYGLPERLSVGSRGKRVSGGFYGLPERLSVASWGSSSLDRLSVPAASTKDLGKAQRVLPRLLAIAGHVPFSNEVVALYYVMLDPETPMAAKLSIAGALLYIVNPVDVPGPADDAAVVAATATKFASYIRPQHRAQAARVLNQTSY